MILIVGGAFQGKKEYAQQQFSLKAEEIADGAVCSEEELCSARAVDHFQEYVRRCLKEGRDTEGLAERLYRSNPKLIVICRELGSGVVPLEAFDRNWREATGRVCCCLAKLSGQVYRVVCGIGTVIKG